MAQKKTRIRVWLNGEAREIAAGLTVAELIGELGQHPRAVAIEHNGAILPRAEYGSTEILESDRLEVVRFVQGG